MNGLMSNQLEGKQLLDVLLEQSIVTDEQIVGLAETNKKLHAIYEQEGGVTERFVWRLIERDEVRLRALASKCACVTEMQQLTLMSDESTRVRFAVANSGMTPIHLLELLMSDESRTVMNAAMDRIAEIVQEQPLPGSLITRLSRTMHPTLRLALVQNPNCPIEVLERYGRKGKSAASFVARELLERMKATQAERSVTW